MIIQNFNNLHENIMPPPPKKKTNFTNLIPIKFSYSFMKEFIYEKGVL